MFTRKNYRAIAEIIKSATQDSPVGGIYRVGRWDAGEDIANDLANFFQQDNPNFDRQKFLDACTES